MSIYSVVVLFCVVVIALLYTGIAVTCIVDYGIDASDDEEVRNDNQ